MNDTSHRETAKAILGLFLNYDQLRHRIGEVEDGYFTEPNHRVLFTAIRETVSKHDVIEFGLVKVELESVGKFDEIGGTAFLQECIEQAPTATLFDSYLANLRVAYWQRVTTNALQQASSDLQKPTCDASDIWNRTFDVVERARLACGKETRNRRDLKTILKETSDKVQDRKTSGRDYSGIPYGFAGIDNLTQGLQDGELHVLAASTSTGKTALALQVALHAAKQTTGVGILSLEMTDLSLSERLLSIHSREIDEDGLPLGAIRSTQNFKDQQWTLFNRASADLRELEPFLVIRQGAQTSKTVIDEILRLVRDGCKLIMLDHLQLVRPESNGRVRSQNDFLGEVTHSLKQIAIAHKVSIILLSQLSRECVRVGRLPELYDLRDSGNIEQDADVCVFLHRERLDSDEQAFNERESMSSTATVLIRKNRNGALG